MCREVYLFIKRSSPFPAHWALWVPNPLHSNPAMGKIINVRGDSMTGFYHEFERGIVLEEKGLTASLLSLGDVQERWIADGEPDLSTDFVAIDMLEEMALRVPAPAKGLRKAFGAGPKNRMELKNCQTWMSEYIALLVEEGCLPPEALGIIKDAPKN